MFLHPKSNVKKLYKQQAIFSRRYPKEKYTFIKTKDNYEDKKIKNSYTDDK